MCSNLRSKIILLNQGSSKLNKRESTDSTFPTYNSASVLQVEAKKKRSRRRKRANKISNFLYVGFPPILLGCNPKFTFYELNLPKQLGGGMIDSIQGQINPAFSPFFLIMANDRCWHLGMKITFLFWCLTITNAKGAREGKNWASCFLFEYRGWLWKTERRTITKATIRWIKLAFESMLQNCLRQPSPLSPS